jgi:hypothetical protein
MVQQTELLMSVAGQTGATSTGPGNQSKWFIVPAKDKRTHLPIALSLSVGTGTFAIEGRNSPNGAVITLASGITASDVQVVARMHQMRVRLTAATGATARAESDVPFKAAE